MYRRPSMYGRRYATTRPTPGFYRRPSTVITRRPLRRRLFRNRGRSGRTVRGIIRSAAEKKFFDVQYISTGPQTTPYVASITDVPQGTTDLTRIGDKLHIHSIEIRMQMKVGMIAAPNVAGTNQLMGRVILFQWKDDDTPTVGNILEVADPMSPFDHDRKVKRKVLMDRTFTLSGQVGTANTNYCYRDIIVSKKYLNLRRLPGEGVNVSFQGASTTGVNKIYILFIADYSTVFFEYYTRLNFTDI